MLTPNHTKSKEPQYWSCSCQKTETKHSQKLTILAMRHGESEHNIKGVVNGNPGADFHITPKGYEQAKALAEQLGSRTDIAAIVTSEMKRTQETAAPLAQKLNLEIQIDSRINDINAGALEGIPILEFRKITDNVKKSVQGSETNEDIARRLKSFLEDLHKCFAGQTVVIISSEIILHSLEQVSKGLPCDENVGEHLKHGIPYEFIIESPIFCPSCGDKCEV